jgi:hypothetical protein
MTISIFFRSKMAVGPNRSQPANFHVVPGHVLPFPQKGLRSSLFQIDDVVRDKPVPAEDEIQRAFALPDPALSQEGDPHAHDVQQDPVDRGGLDEHPLEVT